MNAADVAAQTSMLFDLVMRFAPPILGALLVLFAGWTISNWLRRLVANGLSRTKVDATLQPVLASAVRYIALGLTIMVVLQQFGVETTSLIALIGTIGLAIGLALQGTLSNVAAGLMLLFLRPFQVGDYVSAGGAEGTVLGIDLFHTNLRSDTGVDLSIPNGAILSGNIANMSAFPERILTAGIALDVGVDLDKALAIGNELLRSHPKIQQEGRRIAAVTKSVGAGGVEITLRGWVANEDYHQVRSELLTAVKARFQAAGLLGPPAA